MRKLPKVKKEWAKVYRLAMGNLRHQTTPVSKYYYKCGGMCAAVRYTGYNWRGMWEQRDAVLAAQQDALALFFGKRVGGNAFWYPEGIWPHQMPNWYGLNCTEKRLLAKEQGYTSRIIALELMALYCEEHGE